MLLVLGELEEVRRPEAISFKAVALQTSDDDVKVTKQL